jgi:hypothetical protein
LLLLLLSLLLLLLLLRRLQVLSCVAQVLRVPELPVPVLPGG